MQEISIIAMLYLVSLRAVSKGSMRVLCHIYDVGSCIVVVSF